MNSTISHPPAYTAMAEKVLDDWEERANLLWQISAPIILTFGIPGNILTILVLNRSPKKTAAIRCFQALAVTDLLYLCCICSLSWIGHQFGTFPKDTSLFLCVFYRWGGHSLGLQTIVILIVITIQRVIAVSCPLKSRIFFTKRRMYIIIASVVAACFIYFSYMLFFITYKKNKCGWTENYKENVNETMKWINATLFSFLPFAIIIFSNCFLIRTLSKHARMAVIASPTRIRNFSASTYTVVVVSIVFVVLTFPASVINVLIEIHGAYGDTRYQFAKETGFVLMCTNSAVNFFCYLRTGPVFRKQTVRFVEKKLHIKHRAKRAVKPESPANLTESSDPRQGHSDSEGKSKSVL